MRSSGNGVCFVTAGAEGEAVAEEGGGFAAAAKLRESWRRCD